MEMSVYLYTILMVVALLYGKKIAQNRVYDVLSAGFLFLTGAYMAVNLTSDYFPLFLFVVFMGFIFMLKMNK